MKNDWKRFREIIADPNMLLEEKYGRLVAHIDKMEAELREWLKENSCRFDVHCNCLLSYKKLKEILGNE